MIIFRAEEYVVSWRSFSGIFACFWTIHLYRTSGGVGSAFSAICRQGLLWLRDFYCSLMRLPFFLLYSILWAARRSCDYHQDLKGWSGWVARRPLSVVFSLDSQQPGAAHTSQLPQKLGLLCWY